MKENIRSVAYNILLNIEKNSEYSNIGLDKALNEINLIGRDRAFVKNLVSGVCERRITLDYEIKSHLQNAKTRLKPNVRTILRMGVFEILYCDGIPARASVNEYVNLTKGSGASFAVGLVNAILRRVSESGLLLPKPTEENYDSVRYSMPISTVNYLKSALGNRFDSFAASSLEKAKIYGRVNTLKTDFDALKEFLQKDGIEIESVQTVPDAFYFVNTASFMRTRAFQEGLFHIQDLSSQICCMAVNAKPQHLVLDVCAAPGGKSFTLAQMMQNTGEITSCDIHPHKLGLIRQGAERLGLENIQPLLRNAMQPPSGEKCYDRVLCDVPCSGFGVLRKKSEIKYKNIDEIRNLPELQIRILSSSAKALKPGGILVYSTCTVIPEENDGVVSEFLSQTDDFHPLAVLPEELGEKSAYGRIFMPDTDDCDGFYISILEKSR